MSDGSSPLDEMASYAKAVTDHIEEIVPALEFIRNLTEQGIDQAKGSIGGETIQQLGGAVADVCDTMLEQMGHVRQSATELQHAIQNAGG